MTTVAKSGRVVAVQRVVHRETWRGAPFTLHYVILDGEPSPATLLAHCRWALAEGYVNPRIISPNIIEWSSLFQPTLYAALIRHDLGIPIVPMRFVRESFGRSHVAELRIFWLQSVVFLAAVTLSAAIVQGRWSRGTIESKFDRLWQAAVSPSLSAAVDSLFLRAEVVRLATTTLAPIELLLAVRRLFMGLIARLADGVIVERVVAVTSKNVTQSRFGFARWLSEWLPGLTGVVVYGSSVSGEDFADIDAVLVVKDAEAVLRMLENRRLEWDGKELNVGVYTEAELWRMQVLSGDNLADYGLCIYGEVALPQKPVGYLLARNLSFGIIRQRQQLGMLAGALFEPAAETDDRKNLNQYFIKIPSNVAKGTFGATGTRMSKADVNAWLLRWTGFDTGGEQLTALSVGPTAPLASSALATMKALLQLNSELKIIEPDLECVA